MKIDIANRRALALLAFFAGLLAFVANLGGESGIAGGLALVSAMVLAGYGWVELRRGL